MDNNEANVPPHNLPGGGKQKKKLIPRRALGDIGNRVTAPAVEAISKPPPISRSVTRNNNGNNLPKQNSNVAVIISPDEEKGGQTTAQSKKVAPDTHVVVISPDEDKVKTVEETPSSYLQSNNKHVIVISPDEDKVKTVEETPSSKTKAKKTGRTLTSTLTARSKAARGLSNRPKNEIYDIDAADADNHLAAVEYVEDIYNYYKLTEDEGRVNDYMVVQPELNHKMRAILVDWLIEVHKKFELMPEALYLTVDIFDRFLSVEMVSRRNLQLVGISSMLIACKYEEIWAPEVSEFIDISDNAYSREQILLMEKNILGKLEWYLTVPTPYVFLVRYIKAAAIPSADQEIEYMTFFFSELGLMNYSTTIFYYPSMLAAASVYAARATLNKTPLWTPTLQHYTGYTEDLLMECSMELVGFHSGAAESKLKSIYRKYSSPDRCSVALFPPAYLLPSATSNYK